MSVKLKKLAIDIKQLIKMTDNIMYLISKSIMSKSYLKQIHIYKDNYQQNYTLKDYNDVYNELIKLFEENSKEFTNEGVIINKYSKIDNVIINANLNVDKKDKVYSNFDEMKGSIYSIDSFLSYKNLFELQEVKEFFNNLNELFFNKINSMGENNIINSNFSITLSSRNNDGGVYIYLQLVCNWTIGDYDIF